MYNHAFTIPLSSKVPKTRLTQVNGQWPATTLWPTTNHAIEAMLRNSYGKTRHHAVASNMPHCGN